jgi:hypothetical protein
VTAGTSERSASCHVGVDSDGIAQAFLQPGRRTGGVKCGVTRRSDEYPDAHGRTNGVPSSTSRMKDLERRPVEGTIKRVFTLAQDAAQIASITDWASLARSTRTLTCIALPTKNSCSTCLAILYVEAQLVVAIPIVMKLIRCPIGASGRR